MGYVYNNFIDEFNSLKDVFVIPLGTAVEEVLNELINKGILKEEQVLKGFPHPSGANVNRISQLENNKISMMNIIKNYFS